MAINRDTSATLFWVLLIAVTIIMSALFLYPLYQNRKVKFAELEKRKQQLAIREQQHRNISNQVSALENDPGAVWLREKIISYAMSDGFEPSEKLSVEELSGLFGRSISLGENQNLAQNKNDITM